MEKFWNATFFRQIALQICNAKTLGFLTLNLQSRAATCCGFKKSLQEVESSPTASVTRCNFLCNFFLIKFFQAHIYTYIVFFLSDKLLVWCPKKVLPFDKSLNNSLLLYCLKLFRFYSFIHRLRFCYLSLSNTIKLLEIHQLKNSLVYMRGRIGEILGDQFCKKTGNC